MKDSTVRKGLKILRRGCSLLWRPVVASGRGNFGITVEVRQISGQLSSQFDFDDLEFVGRGKDAFVFRGQSEDFGTVIIKRVSEYFGRHSTNWNHVRPSEFPDVFYTPNWLDDTTFCYPDEGLVHFNSDLQNFLRGLASVCEVEQRLLKRGFLLWDFGYTSPNYMEHTPSQEVRWVDQGGNGICSLQGAALTAFRKNHGKFEQNFFTAMLLLHILIVGLGRKQLLQMASELQDRVVTDEDLGALKGMFPPGPLRTVAEQALSLDFSTRVGWERFAETLGQAAPLDAPQERVDLDLLRFEQDAVEVRGYQNFILKPNEVIALRAGHRWAKTDVKARLVCGYLDSIEFESFVDFGSNLGFYPLRSALRADCIVSHGFDYNPSYILAAKLLAETTGSKAEFFVGKFGPQERSYDVVLMLGLIHHVFSRTSRFGDLDHIVKRLSELTGCRAIVEFPTEHDDKAAKWTNIVGRSVVGEYSEDVFLSAVEKHFAGYELVGYVSEFRPIYGLFKF